MTIKGNNFSNESFCPEVYNQIQIDMQGDLRVCCLSSDGGLTREANGTPMNVKTHSIITAMNSEIHKQHRLDLSNNIKPQRCSNCYNWENHSNDTSRRKKFIRLSQNKLDYVKASEAFDATNDDGSIDVDTTKLINLDIRFGNLCNLKCIMCDPGNSSLWYEDWDLLSRKFSKTEATGRSVKFQLGGIDPVTGNTQYWKDKTKFYSLEKNQYGKLKLQNEENWWETESWKNQFKKIAPQLQHIYFTGGEPLLVPAMEEHLTYLIENDFAKNIMLCYDTNLTVVNSNIINKWKFFKEVDLRVSVDDTGDRYNVVRNPGNFDKLYDNITRIQEANIKIKYISIVCHLANVYGVIRVAKLAKQIGASMSLRFVTRPGWMNVSNLPDSAKEEVISVLTKFLESEESKSIQGYENFVHQQIKHFRDNSTTSTPNTESNLETFVQVMNLMDQSRNLNWKHTLSDIAELLKKHVPGLDI